MPKAINPIELPPRAHYQWARSLKRAGGMYHAHILGRTACGTLTLDRHASAPLVTLGSAQYYGLCGTCLRKVERAAALGMALLRG